MHRPHRPRTFRHHCLVRVSIFFDIVNRILDLEMQEPSISDRGDGDDPQAWRIALAAISGVGLWRSVRSFRRGVLFQVRPEPSHCPVLLLICKGKPSSSAERMIHLQ